MKTRLLAAFLLCGAMTPALPLWASDNWPDPQLEFVTPNLTEDETGGGVYYLYHVATGRFMSDGYWNYSWGTEAEVCEEGQAITFTWGQDYELSRRATTDAEYHDAYGWRMSMKEGATNSDLHELYIPSELSLCTDHNTQGHMLWHIISEAQDGIELGEGCYQICILESDPIYGTSSSTYGGQVTRIGVDTLATASVSVYGVNPLIIEGVEGVVDPKYDWKFVDPDVYEVFIAKRSLQTQLDAADEAGFTDYATYAALYNSDTATADELQTAANALKSDIVSYKFSGLYGNASEDNPVDVTDLIENADFSEDSDWSATATGWTLYRADTSGNFVVRIANTTVSTEDGFEFTNFLERWTQYAPNGDWSVSQDLSGLPDGLYTLSAYVFSTLAESNGGPTGCYLRATTEYGVYQTACDTPSPTSGYAYAYSYSVDFIVKNGTATVGFYVEDATTTNWNGVGYFTMIYKGEATSSVLTSKIEEANALKDELDANNSVYSLSGEEAFTAAISEAETASTGSLTDDEIASYIIVVDDAMNALQEDADAYATLNTLVAELFADWDSSDYATYDFNAYADYLYELEDEYKNRTFDPADLDSVEIKATALWQQAIYDEIVAGNLTNVTGMLTNADFSSNTSTGWSSTQTITAINYGVVEMYDYSTFDVYQELTGLPSGSYTVTCQAFYRPAYPDVCQSSWGTDDGVNDVLVYVYGNDATALVPHCFDTVSDDDMTGGDTYLSAVDETEEIYGKYAANNIQGASIILATGEDEVSVTCFVTDDGVLRVGIKKPSSTGSQSGNWTAFDDFQVTFLGTDDMSGAESALSALIESATETLNSDTQVTADAKDTLNMAITDANTALLGTLTSETYTASVSAINDALDAYEESAEVVADFFELIDLHLTALDKGEYEDYDSADPTLYSEFYDLIDNYYSLYVEKETVIDNADSIATYTLIIEKMFSQLVACIVDTDGASLDNGVDVTGMIQTPSFSTGEDDDMTTSDLGWTATGGSATGYIYEFYNLEDPDIHQTLYALPKGYYRLAYNGFYRAGGYAAASQSRYAGTEELTAQVYAIAGENYWSQTLASIFDDMKEYKYTTSDIVLADSLFPESNLLYKIIVNTATGAYDTFLDGNYANSFSFYVEEDGQEVTIGVNKSGIITGDWVAFDNFTLTYYGDGSDNQPSDYVSAIDEVSADDATSVVSTAWYTVNGVRVAEPAQKGIYIRQQVLSDGTQSTVKVIVK